LPKGFLKVQKNACKPAWLSVSEIGKIISEIKEIVSEITEKIFEIKEITSEKGKTFPEITEIVFEITGDISAKEEIVSAKEKIVSEITEKNFCDKEKEICERRNCSCDKGNRFSRMLPSPSVPLPGEREEKGGFLLPLGEGAERDEADEGEDI